MDRHSHTTKLIAARQDGRDEIMPLEHRMTRRLRGRRSLAHRLSDCRRVLCNRAGGAAAQKQTFLTGPFDPLRKYSALRASAINLRIGP
jgi:hypothetical protein